MEDQRNILSPLDQIRLLESEITRQLTAAQITAEQKVTQARLQAEHDQKKASELSHQQDQALIQEIINQTEDEARTIHVEGQRKCAAFSQHDRQRMKEAVGYAVSVVLGLSGQESLS